MNKTSSLALNSGTSQPEITAAATSTGASGIADSSSIQNAKSMKHKVLQLTNSQTFEAFMSVVIFLNIVLMIIETDETAECVVQHVDATDCTKTWLLIINIVFLSIYTVESALRLYGERLSFFKSGWNYLDSFIIVCGWVDLALSLTVGSMPGPSASLLRIFRITRLVRIVRILQIFPELYALVKGFLGAMRSMFWGFIMILTFVIIFSIVSVEVLNPINIDLTHDNDFCLDAFSSIWNCIVLFIQTLVAGDSWGACAIPIIQKSKVASLLFVASLVSIQLGVTNLILAVIVDRANKAHEEDVENNLRVKAQQHKRAAGKLKVALENIDTDSSGTISLEELDEGFRVNPALQQLLQSLDIERDDLDEFFLLLDEYHNGEVAYDRLIQIMLSAREDDVRKQLMMLRLQSSQIVRSLMESKKDMTKSVMNLNRSGSSAGEPSSSFPLPNPSKVHLMDNEVSLLHQNLKTKLSELEREVLQTIDSWATSRLKMPFMPDVLEIPKEREAIPPFTKVCEKDGLCRPLAASLQLTNGTRGDILLELKTVNEDRNDGRMTL